MLFLYFRFVHDQKPNPRAFIVLWIPRARTCIGWFLCDAWPSHREITCLNNGRSQRCHVQQGGVERCCF